MPTGYTNYVWLDLSPHMDISADIADLDVVIVTVPVPFAGVVKAVWACADILPADATLTVQNAVGTTDVSLLAATCDVDADLTVNVGEALTLTTSTANLRVAAGNMLRATWTFTTIGSGEGFACLVAIEPDLA